ncbi:tyrosine-type recombinase/integrase [Spirochaeta dissipatitropha]
MAEARYHLNKRQLKGKSIYYARFIGDELDDRGRPKYKLTLCTNATRKSEAIKIAEKWLRDGTVSDSRSDIIPYLAEFWQPDSEYIRTKEIDSGRTISPEYIRLNHRHLERFVIPWLERHHIRQLNQLDHNKLLKWRNDLISGKIKGAENLTTVSKNKVRQALWVALNWAVETGLLDKHPGARIKRANEHQENKASGMKRAHAVLTLPELATLFKPEYWRDSYGDYFISRACALFCVSVGARQGEARGLVFENINLETGIVDIRQSWQDGQGMKPPKWGSVRVGLPLGDHALTAIHEIVDRYPYDEINPDSFVFPNLHNPEIPTNKHTLNKALKRALSASGLADTRPAVGFHDLRHTWASHSATALPDAVRKYALGHSGGDTTDIYTHVTEQYAAMLREFQSNLIPAYPAL